MPIIDLSLTDIERLIGKRLPREPELLNEAFQYVAGEVEALEGDNLQLNIQARNRPDLWCAEGIARELRGAFGIETGSPKYNVKKSDFEVRVDRRLRTIRPYIACAVVSNVNLTDEMIQRIMQQQDKIDGNYGRNRRRTSIGLYNARLLKFPLSYTTTNPDKNAFVPLQMTRKLTPRQILSSHPKGREYGHILEGLRNLPIFMDAESKVLSMPPIINSNDLGKLNEQTREILIEVTGTNYEAVQNTLKIMALTLADRGGQINAVHISYPYNTPAKRDITPHLKPEQTINLDLDMVNKRLGTEFTTTQATAILKRGRYDVLNKKGRVLAVSVPAYRTDILHPVDVVEDIAIHYGYNNFEPQELRLPTVGGLSKETQFEDKVRELMVGFGSQEVMTFTLVDKGTMKSKIKRKGKKLIEVTNPINNNYTVLRDEIWPNLLDLLNKNTTREIPQRVFEVGEVAVPNPKAETGADISKRLSYCYLNNMVTFTEAKQVLQALMGALGIKFEVWDADHPAFLDGRLGKVMVDGKDIGIIGEIHPEVLQNFGIKLPVVCFDINISVLL